MPGCSIGLLFQGWSREVPLRLRLYHMPSRELPPLARGLPSPSCSASAGGGDHPRSRGVYGASSLLQLLIGGSSPLARGLRRCAFMTHVNGRIIPARAGFTAPALRPAEDRSDHPRSRGVYSSGIFFWIAMYGSSPLARGLRRVMWSPRGSTGIIPARAGFTGADMDAQHIRRGSSPLARGLPYTIWTGEHEPGIIPARAGFTPTGASWGGSVRDHPRSRGVYNSASNPSARARGSSPLARGLPSEWDRLTETFRIIPARAGFTSGRWPGTPASRDHPRSRGVYVTGGLVVALNRGSSPLARGLLIQTPRLGYFDADHPRSRGVYASPSATFAMEVGSSPLARGLQEHDPQRDLAARIIPARAGFTEPRSPTSRPLGDHPRSRGVYPPCLKCMIIIHGSSPLARGLQCVRQECH